MDDQERRQRNKQAIQDLRKATALYIVQLRNLGLSEEEVELVVQEANLETARKMGALLPGEEKSDSLFRVTPGTCQGRNGTWSIIMRVSLYSSRDRKVTEKSGKGDLLL